MELSTKSASWGKKAGPSPTESELQVQNVVFWEDGKGVPWCMCRWS